MNNKEQYSSYEPNKELIYKLREETGAGMMTCKRALKQSNGNLEEAKERIKEIETSIFILR